MFRFRDLEINKIEIARVYISGSSGSGKTFFAKKLLNSSLLNYDNIYYFHPDFHETSPVDWHNTVTDNMCYHPGLPDLQYLLDIPSKSCLVFDDLYTQCCESKDIDYLFRVLSSKRKLNIIIMTQRYFGDSKLGLNIRNCCNFHVLLANADARTNIRVANYMQLKPEISQALLVNKYKEYPYIFIDKTAQARVTGLAVYTEIFGKYKEVICGSMKYFLLSETDFKTVFNVKGKFAEINEDARSKISKSYQSPENKVKNETSFKHKTRFSKYVKEKRLRRQVENIVQRSKIRTEL